VLAAVIAIGFYLVNRGAVRASGDQRVQRLHGSTAMVFVSALGVLCAVHYMMPDADVGPGQSRASHASRASGHAHASGRRPGGRAPAAVRGGGYVFD
jgi:hypothetical protein